MRRSRGKKVKWTQALGVRHKMPTATSPQGTAMRSPSFLLSHGRLEPSTKPSRLLGPWARDSRASLKPYGCFLPAIALLLAGN